MEHVRDINFSFKDSNEKARFEKNALPQNYELNLQKSKNEIEEFQNKILQKNNR
jgi:hypothetical protein